MKGRFQLLSCSFHAGIAPDHGLYLQIRATPDLTLQLLHKGPPGAPEAVPFGGRGVASQRQGTARGGHPSVWFTGRGAVVTRQMRTRISDGVRTCGETRSHTIKHRLLAWRVVVVDAAIYPAMAFCTLMPARRSRSV